MKSLKDTGMQTSFQENKKQLASTKDLNNNYSSFRDISAGILMSSPQIENNYLKDMSLYKDKTRPNNFGSSFFDEHENDFFNEMNLEVIKIKLIRQH